MKTLAPLDQDQQRVVDATESSIRVVAPAGSGKTQTLVQRVLARMRAGVPDERILILTFDKNAQLAFSTRLDEERPDHRAQVQTLNAFGYSLLRTMFRDERQQLYTGLFFPETPYYTAIANDYGVRTFQEMLSRIKNECQDPRVLSPRSLAPWIAANLTHILRDLENERIEEDDPSSDPARDLAQEFMRYEEFLRDRGAIDFDDQKLRPWIRLRDDDHARRQVQAMFDEVIVDEFQDVNTLDVRLIQVISERASLIITGDDDQAIYGFRGADSTFLVDADAHFGRPFASYELRTNYRCPPRILDAADLVIRNNEHRIAKHPSSARPEPGYVEVVTNPTARDEATMVAKRAAGALHKGSVAILNRTNLGAIDLQAACVLNRAPYTVARTQDIRIHWEYARRMLHYADELRHDPLPPDDARADITTMFAAVRRQGSRALDRIGQTARTDPAFPSPLALAALSPADQTRFVDSLERLKNATSVRAEIRALETFLNASMTSDTDRAVRTSRLDGLYDIVDLARGYKPKVLNLLNELIRFQREALRNPGEPKIDITTCHGAKGREWATVFVPKCVEGQFPDSRNDAGRYLEAERKLFYVSMTRAAQTLILSWGESRTTARSAKATEKPSPFLDETGLLRANEPERQRRRGTGAIVDFEDGPLFARSRPNRPQPHPPVAPERPATRPMRMLHVVSPRFRSQVNGASADSVVNAVTRIATAVDDGLLRPDQVAITYPRHDPDATLTLQLGLALRQIPFTIETSAHHVTRRELLGQMTSSWHSTKRLVPGSLGADLVGAMERVLEALLETSDTSLWQEAIDTIPSAGGGTESAGVLFRS